MYELAFAGAIPNSTPAMYDGVMSMAF